MANPKEKIFILYHGLPNGPTYDALLKYVEGDMSGNSRTEPTKYIHWMRLRGGRAYIFGTLENTVWTVERITAKLRKHVPDIGSFFVTEIQGHPYSGLMEQEFWDFIRRIQDLTKYINGHRRGQKLRKIKALIDKKEELKRKELELKNREIALLEKKGILSEEEELLKKEELIRMEEAEVAKKETEIKKRKKILGIF